MEVVVHYASTNRQKTVRWKGNPDAIFSDGQKNIQLHPAMSSYDEAKKRFVAHVDGEKWLQIGPGGAYAWVGPDPRIQMGARVAEIRRNLQRRGIDYTKFMWPLIVFVGMTFAALLGALVFGVSK